MRFYLDTEFIESGYAKVELISIGIVSQYDHEYYAVCRDGWELAHASPWLFENVMPHLGAPWRSRADIAKDILTFVGSTTTFRGERVDEKPEFWGHFSDYDWVLFCQLFGTMMDLPKGWPQFCRDVKQMCVDLGNPTLPKQESDEHNALADARHIKKMHEFLAELKNAKGSGP